MAAPCAPCCARTLRHSHRAWGRLSPLHLLPPWWHSAPAETFVPTSHRGAGMCHAGHLSCHALPGLARPLSQPLCQPGTPGTQWLVAEQGAEACRPSLHPSLCPSVSPQEVIQQQAEVSCCCWVPVPGALGMLYPGVLSPWAAATLTQPMCPGPACQPLAVPCPRWHPGVPVRVAAVALVML